MKVIVLMSQKGGAGKTTVTLHLAAEAQARGHRVVVLDADPQGSALAWAEARGAGKTPAVFDVHGRAVEGIQAARQEGYDLVLVDTEPRSSARVLQIAKEADLQVVVSRPTALDAHAARETIDALQGARLSARVVLNSALPRVAETDEARQFFTAAGAVVWPGALNSRVSYQRALASGMTVSELEPRGEAAREIHELANWLL